MNGLQIFLFGVFPYICLTSFIVGHIWRWKYDRFGWTARSSEWYEKRTLRWASPMFHFGGCVPRVRSRWRCNLWRRHDDRSGWSRSSSA